MTETTTQVAEAPAADAPERKPKKLCQVCLAYDDHPRLEALVTADGPLGNHSPGEVSKVAAVLTPLLPANMDEVEQALTACHGNVSAQEQVYKNLIPDPDQYDAARAWHSFLHPNDFGAHFDCYRDGLPAEHQLQMSIDAQDPDTGEVLSVEDTRKAVIDDPRHAHTWAGVDQGLKGDDLRAHLAAHPPIPDYVPAAGEVA